MIPWRDTDYVRAKIARACMVPSNVPLPLVLVYSPRIRPDGLELVSTGDPFDSSVRPMLNLVRLKVTQP